MEVQYPPFRSDEKMSDNAGHHISDISREHKAGHCIWFDSSANVCKHYEDRPEVCRAFQKDSFSCHFVRKRLGVE